MVFSAASYLPPLFWKTPKTPKKSHFPHPYYSTRKLYHSSHLYGFSAVCILIWILKELLCEKDFFTLTALFWFFLSMHLQMCYKMNILWKSFNTLTAMIWLLSCMCPHVAHKITITRKTFVTNTGLEGFFTCVYSHMVFKMTFLWIRFATLSALIRFLPSVCSKVVSKINICWKSFSTLTTYIWSLLCVFLNDYFVSRACHTGCTGMASCHYVSFCVL